MSLEFSKDKKRGRQVDEVSKARQGHSADVREKRSVYGLHDQGAVSLQSAHVLILSCLSPRSFHPDF